MNSSPSGIDNMINVETICFLLVVVGSLGLFYYLGWLAGRESLIRDTLVWSELEEEEKEND